MVRKQLPSHSLLLSLECFVYCWCPLACTQTGPGSWTVVIFGKPSLTLRSCLCLGFPAFFHDLPRPHAPVWKLRPTLTFSRLGNGDSTPHHAWILLLGNNLATDKRLTWVIITFLLFIKVELQNCSNYDLFNLSFKHLLLYIQVFSVYRWVCAIHTDS